MSGSEFPGFALPDAPRFTGVVDRHRLAADDGATYHDLAMVFGSRLWGHEIHDVLELAAYSAPGCGDLLGSSLRGAAVEELCLHVSRARGDDADLRALVLHTGSEAVETALKTALRATGRSRIVAFEGAYHGTSGLALAVTHGTRFRDPWSAQYAATVRWERWGEVPELDEQVACVVVEPWLGRAGVVPPAEGFHARLRVECDRVGAMLVLDDVLCGSGRTGDIAQCVAPARPELLCLGKALGGGVTASAVIAEAAVAAAAWERGDDEPAHTSTSLGDPLACAGIAWHLPRLEDHARAIDTDAAAWGELLAGVGGELDLQVRGAGLLWALDTGRAGGGVALARRLLHQHRIIVVPSGVEGGSITIYPAVAQFAEAGEVLRDALCAVAASAG